MTNRHLTTINLENFLRNAIGLDRYMNSVQNYLEHGCNNGNYPPYNIIQTEEDHYTIEVAVAGFTSEEITVTVDNGRLSIVGEHKEEEDVTEPDYVFKGISSRAFERAFVLAEHVEVQEAKVENGILTVDLERIVPESLKPKQIEVK